MGSFHEQGDRNVDPNILILLIRTPKRGALILGNLIKSLDPIPYLSLTPINPYTPFKGTPDSTLNPKPENPKTLKP